MITLPKFPSSSRTTFKTARIMMKNSKKPSRQNSKMSSETGMSRVPVEIQRKILDYLDHESMLKASRVCKSWNDIISTSSKFLKSTEVNLNANEISNSQLTRKYRHLIINGGNYELRKPDLLSISNVCEYLETLEFVPDKMAFRFFHFCGQMQEKHENAMTLAYMPDFIEFLKLCVNLKTLHLRFSDKTKDHQPLGKVVAKLPKLRSLTLVGCDWLVKYLDVEDLEHICLVRFDVQVLNKKSTQDNHIVEFMNKQQNLNKIEFQGIELKSAVVLKPKFQWRNLKIVDIYTQMNNNWQKLIDVAGPGSKISVGEEVDLGFTPPLLMMIKNQPNITKVTYQMRTYDYLIEVDESTKLNHVRELAIRVYEGMERSEENAMPYKRFPTVQEFELVELLTGERSLKSRNDVEQLIAFIA